MTTENKASFFARLEPRLAPSDLLRVRGAYYMAKYGHRAQVRKELDDEGKPLRYFEHPRRVDIILMDEFNIYDPDILCTGLLHDVLEDTDDIDADIIELFYGINVALNTRLLTKDPKEGYFHRLLHASDGVKLVKLCDRLDNLRSLPTIEDDLAFVEKTLRDTYVLVGVFHIVGGLSSPIHIRDAQTKALAKVTTILKQYKDNGICVEEYDKLENLLLGSFTFDEAQAAF